MSNSRPLKTIIPLLEYVTAAGDQALKNQRLLNFSDRGYKADGSILTEIDKKTEDYLFEQISRIYPGANIITEETVRFYDPEREYTFTIDPIDGTDTFSQGMNGWCITIGLLDSKLQPIAGIVYSPPLKMLVFADIGKPAELNGEIIETPDPAESISPQSNLMVPSRCHRLCSLSLFPGKLRNIGSAALHLIYPLIYPGIYGTIEGSGTHIWDIAGAHAINLSLGLDFLFSDGSKFSYSSMTDGSTAGKVFIAGSKYRISEIQKIIVLL